LSRVRANRAKKGKPENVAAIRAERREGARRAQREG